MLVSELFTVTDGELLPAPELRVMVLLDGIVTTIALEIVEQAGALLITTL
jgi:hypothetical protein